MTETALSTNVLSQDEINAALRAAGMAEPENPSSGINRCTMNGFMFTFDDGSVATSNPKTGAPAFRARLLDKPTEYQAAWLSEKLAEVMGRPGDANGFCKSHFDDPQQARKYSDKGADCSSCPIGPFVPKANVPIEAEGRKCAWKADLPFQLVDENGEISDPTVHQITLSTTGIIEFKGTAKNPVQGSVSDLCFTQKLARFGMEQTPDNPTAGMVQALTALPLGGVIVDVRALPARSDDGSRTWTVASFTPVAIIDVSEQAAALPEPAAPAATPTGDDLPF